MERVVLAVLGLAACVWLFAVYFHMFTGNHKDDK